MADGDIQKHDAQLLEQLNDDATTNVGGSDTREVLGPLPQDTALIALIDDEAAQEPDWWTTQHAFSMSALVLLFGLLAVALSRVLISKNKLPVRAILQVVVLPMVVAAAMFFIVAGYGDSQIAPAMGLMGTIVGYLLGERKAVNEMRPRDAETERE